MTDQTLFFTYLEFSESAMAPVMKRLVQAGGQEVWNKGVKYIFSFDTSQGLMSALEQILALQEESSSLKWKAITHLGKSDDCWMYLQTLQCNQLYLTDSLVASLEPIEVPLALKACKVQHNQHGEFIAHQLKLPTNSDASSGSLKLQSMKPAPFGKRIVAAITDYILAVSLFFFMNACWNFPSVYRVYMAQQVWEAEQGTIEHAETITNWTSSGSKAVKFGKRGKVSDSFPFEANEYKVALVHSAYTPEPLSIRVVLGNNEFFFVQPHQRKMKRLYLPGTYQLKEGDYIKIESLSNNDDYLLDYINFLPPGAPTYSNDRTHITIAQEHLIRLIGFWEYDDLKYHIWDLTAKCGAIFLIIQILFLSYFTWTPGALVGGVRILPRKRFGPPGPRLAMRRCLGYLISIPCAGIGWIWPLFSSSSQNWADILSDTRVAEYRGWNDEA
jgi:hypothetical protein